MGSTLENRFQTGQGHFYAFCTKWCFTDNEMSDSGEIQTMSYIVDSCPQASWRSDEPTLGQQGCWHMADINQ